uniref:B30.2/SPRY domain-containing protein n=2 Tax=Salarias fasciatus TaxID=181472 RepID=A0A672G644_SALFA
IMTSDMAVAALSQPFTLGMLVDARKDRLTPGFMLWDDKTIQESTEVTPHHSSETFISTSDSTESKTSLLDVNTSLKASFLGGLIEVNGSAKYLNDQKKFINQSRVTFQYKATTNFKQLSLAHLGNMDPQQMSVIEKDFATHIVTKILYGANAFFVFDSEKLDSSSVQKMEGSMEAVINKIPSFTAEGNVKIELTEEEKSLIQKFSCKFYGDFILESNPATFVDAVKTFAELPKLLGENGEKTVPVKVWLMPLKNLSTKAPDLLTDLSVGLVRRVEETLEDVKQMESRCNESLVDGVGEDFPQIQEDLHRYQKLCNYYTSNLQQALEKKLPSIREGKEDESSLKQLFDSRATSPFSHENLLKWLEGKEREINVIRSCVEIMEGVKIVHNQSELDREVLSPGVQYTLCFVFTSLESADPCLDAMDQYLDSLQPRITTDIPWYYSDEVLTRMREKARTFHDLANKLKKYKKCHFLVAAIENKNHTGATIYQYKDGILITDDFLRPVPPVETIKDKTDLIRYVCDLTVDPDTVSNSLYFSEEDGSDGKEVFKTSGHFSYPDNPKRFNVPQFMCRESLTGRHYWEVEWSPQTLDYVAVAVAYDGIERKQDSGLLQNSPKAWGLRHVTLLGNGIIVFHYPDDHLTWRDATGHTRIGVYLDWPAGTLSFYIVSSDTLSHIYTFRTRFTEPLYPTFLVGYPNSYIRLPPPL